MTKIGGANYAGFRSDSHILQLWCEELYTYVLVCLCIVIAIVNVDSTCA